MPASDSPDILVARYLTQHGYDDTLAAFLVETNLPADSITTRSTDLTIEKVLQEKKLYDLAISFEKTEICAGDIPFTTPHPSIEYDLTGSALGGSNVLFVSIEKLALDGVEGDYIVATTADRCLRIYEAKTGELKRTYSPNSGGNILSVAVMGGGKYILTASMSGQVVLSSLEDGEVVWERKEHTKFVVKLSNWTFSNGDTLVASAGYDRKVVVYKLTFPAEGKPMAQILGQAEFATTCEDVLFVEDYRAEATKKEPLLIVTLRDSPYLHYHTLPDPTSSDSATPSTLTLSYKASLKSTDASWLTFTPTSPTPSPVNPHILAIATSSTISIKILLYDQLTQSITKEFYTGAAQSAYSTAVVSWRPDGSGVWVNGDDGAVRGIEVMSGTVKVMLPGHGKMKVRAVAGGKVGEEEVVVSGGFDSRLLVWRVKEETESA